MMLCHHNRNPKGLIAKDYFKGDVTYLQKFLQLYKFVSQYVYIDMF